MSNSVIDPRLQQYIKGISDAVDDLNYELDSNYVSLPADAKREFKECRDLFKQTQEKITAEDANRLTASITTFREKGVLLPGNIALKAALSNMAAHDSRDIKVANSIINRAAAVYGHISALMKATGQSAEYSALIIGFRGPTQLP